ncbi:hydroxylase [Lysobacteraceae bacterium NML120232]|nr:hydroxylase [Xanthomonadaceae bacterium NML08-0793]PJK09699.1 hydroxylase [Xanthomonadaceae bacterium NML120232]
MTQPQPDLPLIDTDVLVIGGGPAGSCAATVLAQKGWRVVMLEKDRHPRFHIGESLLPMNMPILERIGALEKARAVGLLKLGADFPAIDGTFNVFDFGKTLNPGTPDFAFQVKREEFDQMLFEHAREQGVDARDGIRVERVEFDADDAITVHAAGQRWRPRYLLDASGRDTFLGNKLKLKRKNPRHASAAVFSHFQGVARREGRHAGNVSIYRHEHGWAWMIPLRDGSMSVGAVCWPEYLKTRRGDTESFLMQTLASVPEIAQRMQGAKRIAPVHVTGNYAYECTRMHGRHWSMLGDAYAFVDPMFSSGVYLAMHSAEQGALMVDKILQNPAHEAKLQRKFQRDFEAGLDEFKWFIYRFTSPVMRALFSAPRDFMGVERAIVSMLAGDVFNAPQVIRKLRIFRIIYALNAIEQAPAAWRAWRKRRRQVKVEMREETLQG